MSMPTTLSGYYARQVTTWFLAIMGGLLAIVYVGEALELLRRASAHADVSFELVLRMAFLKIGGTAQVLFPSAVLFTALFSFWRFTRSHELEVTRAAGISAWSFIAPLVLTALLFGVVQVALLNPLSASMSSRFSRLEDRYLRGRVSTLDVSKGGIWISQADTKAQAFIHADTVKPGTFELQRVIVFVNPHDIRTGYRIDAETAQLGNGAWTLKNAWVSENGKPAVQKAEAVLPTDLTTSRIEESFAPPETVPFWELPKFIHTLEAAGLSSLRHRLFYESLLARPLLLAAMVVLAAVFGLRQTRRGGVFAMAISGLVIGLLLYVGNDVVQTFAQTGGIPILLAAWGPALIGLMGGAAALFHLEDG